jgi:hypothetical protein
VPASSWRDSERRQVSEEGRPSYLLSWSVACLAFTPVASYADSPNRVLKPCYILGQIDYSWTIVAIAFPKDGKRMAGGRWAVAMKLWDPRTGKLLADLTDKQKKEFDAVAVFAGWKNSRRRGPDRLRRFR